MDMLQPIGLGCLQLGRREVPRKVEDRAYHINREDER